LQRAGARIRVAVRLLEATTGRHVWAERYDRPEGDLFDLQDEVAQSIVTAVSLRVTDAELSAARRKPPPDLRVYELFLRGNALSDVMNMPAQAEALSFFEQARAADPDYARAYSGIAIVQAAMPTIAAMGQPPALHLSRALEAAKAALERDPD